MSSNSALVTPTVQSVLDTNVDTAVDRVLADVIPYIEHVMEVVVDFGTTGSSDMAKTTVTGQTWVTAHSHIVPVIKGKSVAVDDEEDALLDQVSCCIANIQPGIGFDVLAHAPEGTYGTYLVHLRGV